VAVAEAEIVSALTASSPAHGSAKSVALPVRLALVTVLLRPAEALRWRALEGAAGRSELPRCCAR
jgi:hypothetical protein